MEHNYLVEKKMVLTIGTVRFGYKERKKNELLPGFHRYLGRRKFLNHKEPYVSVLFICQHFGRKIHFTQSYLKLSISM